MNTEKLKELVGAATPGPWVEYAGYIRSATAKESRGKSITAAPVAQATNVLGRGEQNKANAALIVAAVNALPSLIARLEAAEKVAAEINDFIEQDAEVWVDTLDAWRSQLNPAYDQEKARG